MQGFDAILNFIVAHWILGAAFVGVLILLVLNEWRFRGRGMVKLNTQQLVEKLNHSGAVVVDIRSAERFQLGHILHAINIPEAEVQTRSTQLNKYKNKPIIIVCATGIDSPKAGKILKDQGFSELYYLYGGMQEWNSQNMPVSKKN
jgi:rhodanese-related sulfurtransferase